MVKIMVSIIHMTFCLRYLAINCINRDISEWTLLKSCRYSSCIFGESAWGKYDLGSRSWDFTPVKLMKLMSLTHCSVSLLQPILFITYGLISTVEQYIRSDKELKCVAVKTSRIGLYINKLLMKLLKIEM